MRGTDEHRHGLFKLTSALGQKPPPRFVPGGDGCSPETGRCGARLSSPLWAKCGHYGLFRPSKASVTLSGELPVG
jgi:hypothetical protein